MNALGRGSVQQIGTTLYSGISGARLLGLTEAIGAGRCDFGGRAISQCPICCILKVGFGSIADMVQ